MVATVPANPVCINRPTAWAGIDLRDETCNRRTKKTSKWKIQFFSFVPFGAKFFFSLHAHDEKKGSNNNGKYSVSAIAVAHRTLSKYAHISISKWFVRQMFRFACIQTHTQINTNFHHRSKHTHTHRSMLHSTRWIIAYNANNAISPTCGCCFPVIDNIMRTMQIYALHIYNIFISFTIRLQNVSKFECIPICLMCVCVFCAGCQVTIFPS